jgi:hypothetical protein
LKGWTKDLAITDWREDLDWHPSEDDLILHFYGDDEAADETRVDAHLNACASCQASWVEFRETMQMIDAAHVPEPDAGFERVVWARLQPSLAELRPRRASWLAWPRALVPVGAMAAVVVASAVTLRMAMPVGPHGPARAGATSSTATAALDQKAAALQRERVLLTALNGHFDDAQLILTELLNTPEGSDTDFKFARQTAGDLVASGRLYRATAEQNGNVRLAAMLDDLETVLTDVAQTPDRMNASDLKSLRARITNSNLLFKVQALANDVRERQKTLATE